MDLLVKLNEEGITMVMVTHDDSLKNCAHRIVHMLDGRIHRIKTVSPQDRSDQILRLRTATRTLRTGLSLDAPVSASPNQRSTTIRKPADYMMKPKELSVPPHISRPAVATAVRRETEQTSSDQAHSSESGSTS
jgi:ABC-type sulfate/molybdate transport systems ATPase subunit